MTDIDRFTAPIMAGDTRAFGDFMAHSEATVRASLRSFAAQVDTESVIQETFLRVWQVAPRFQHDGEANGLLRLSLRIARNLAISETRRLRTRAAYADDLEQRARADEVARAPKAPDPLLRKLIEACRAQLPKKPARVLRERLENQGRDPDTTLAARLGMTKNTFLQNFTRARRFLAQCLEQQGVDLGGRLTAKPDDRPDDRPDGQT